MQPQPGIDKEPLMEIDFFYGFNSNVDVDSFVNVQQILYSRLSNMLDSKPEIVTLDFYIAAPKQPFIKRLKTFIFKIFKFS